MMSKEQKKMKRRDLMRILGVGSVVGVGTALGTATMLGNLPKTKADASSANDPTFDANGVQLPSLVSDPSHRAGSVYSRSDLGLLAYDDGTNYNRLNMGYGNYDYYITAVGANYVAFDRQGIVKVTNTTPDIWALLNSIDGLTTAGDIYTVAIARGSFTGSATFAPKSNTGYRLVGLANVTPNGSAEGTWLIHTGTGVAINTATHWSSPNYSYQSQHFEAHYLSIVAAAASGHIIDLTNSNGWLFDSCTINGAANYASIVSGSVGIYDAAGSGSSSENGRKKVIQNCGFGCLDTQVALSVDHLLIVGWESNVYKTTGIAITSDGAPMDDVIIGAHQYQKGSSCTHAFIYDTRDAPAFSSLTNSLITLTMINIQSENNSNGHYSSTNGAYYTDIGSADSFLMPLQPGVVAAKAVVSIGTGATTMASFTPFAAGGQEFTVEWALSCATGTTPTLTLSWTDPKAGAQSITLYNTAMTANTVAQGSYSLVATSGAAILVSATALAAADIFGTAVIKRGT